MSKKSLTNILILNFITLFFVLSGCNNGNDDRGEDIYDSPKKGTIYISVDESFKPVIDEQIKVYRADFPEANIIASYKSEADCFRDLQNDSTRMIIVARKLKKEEFEIFKHNLDFYPKNFRLAWDAISVIVNAASSDTVFSLKRLRELVTAQSTTGKTLVVDGLNATSTVLYLQDSIAMGRPLGPNVKGVQGSKAVIEYVANNINAIGFVGSSWVGNEYDPEQVAYFGKVKAALIEVKNDSLQRYAKPSQATISNDQYAFVRPIWGIVKEHTNTTQLGMGFMGFMRGERGQLIFRRANLVPAEMYFGLRHVIVGEREDSSKAK